MRTAGEGISDSPGTGIKNAKGQVQGQTVPAYRYAYPAIRRRRKWTASCTTSRGCPPRMAPACGPRSFSKAARCTAHGAATPNPRVSSLSSCFFPIYAWGAALASGFARTVPWSRSGMCTTGIVRSAWIADSAWKAVPPRRGKCPENA